MVELLEQYALDTITVDSTQGSRGQQLTTLTLVCKADDGDQVAAALLQVRAAAAAARVRSAKPGQGSVEGSEAGESLSGIKV